MSGPADPAKARSRALFTIGHSNRSLEEFSSLLHHFGISLVVDVRRFPASGSNPQFNEEALARSLSRAGIGYRRLAALGGRRGRALDIPAEVNAHWTNRSFHNYADHALSEEFRQGLQQLCEWAEHERVAVMCSEAVWWRCHRRIIADHLLAQGEGVVHITDRERAEQARLTQGAVVRRDGGVEYPGEAATQ